MSGGRLSALQWRILELLSGLEPVWTLTGGGALAGIHLRHRTTRDLDLFWRQLDQLGSLPGEVRARLTAAGLDVVPIQTSSTFVRFRVNDPQEVCVVDLVADPGAPLEAPLRITAGQAASIAVDTPHEILVNKLCALLSRSEIRDLQDVRELVEHGGDLERGLADAPRKDGGFSPLTLAWVLRSLPAEKLAAAAGLPQDQGAELEKFKQRLVRILLDKSVP